MKTRVSSCEGVRQGSPTTSTQWLLLCRRLDPTSSGHLFHSTLQGQNSCVITPRSAYFSEAHALAANVSRHEVQSASAPLNVRGFRNSSRRSALADSCSSCCCLRSSGTVFLRPEHVNHRPESPGCSHMFFHVRDALHQIMNCRFRH